MCGICFVFNNNKNKNKNCNNSSTSSLDFTLIKQRGPDYYNTISVSNNNHNNNNNNVTVDSSSCCEKNMKQKEENALNFHASVLSLQRDKSHHLVQMPFQQSKSILIWNGEIFCGGGFSSISSSSTSTSTSSFFCDTQHVANSLFQLEEQFSGNKQKFIEAVCSFFRSIGGPFAFAYGAFTFFDKQNNSHCDDDENANNNNNNNNSDVIIFGRDSWGRRSLMVGKNKEQTEIVLSSTVLPSSSSISSEDDENDEEVSATAASAASNFSSRSHSHLPKQFIQAASESFRKSLPEHMFVQQSEISVSELKKHEQQQQSEQQKQNENSNNDSNKTKNKEMKRKYHHHHEVTKQEEAKNDSNNSGISQFLKNNLVWEEIPPDGIYCLLLKKDHDDAVDDDENRSEEFSPVFEIELAAKYVDVIGSDNNNNQNNSCCCPVKENSSSSVTTSQLVVEAKGDSSSNNNLLKQQQPITSVRLHPLSDAAKFSTHRAFLPIGTNTNNNNSSNNSSSSSKEENLCVHDSFLQLVDEIYSIFTSTCSENNSNINNDDYQQLFLLHKNISLIVNKIVSWVTLRTHWGPKEFRDELIEVIEKNFVHSVTNCLFEKLFSENEKTEKTTTTTNFGFLVCLTCSFVYTTFLAISVHRRTASWNIHAKPSKPSNSNQNQNENDESSSSILVLFSGGVDCTVLARLADILIPDYSHSHSEQHKQTSSNNNNKIDLVNIAFGVDASDCMVATDRISCLDSSSELLWAKEKFDSASFLNTEKSNNSENSSTTISGSSTMRLLLGDITGDELLQHAPQIAACVLPRNTVMDTCIGSALYFGSRGMGRQVEISSSLCSSSSETKNCEKKVQLLLPSEFSSPLKFSSSNSSSSSEKEKFLPLLTCLVRHYIDRGQNELTLCMLGKDYTSDDLQKINREFHFKSLRDQVEAAQKAGVVKMRWVTRTPTIRARSDIPNYLAQMKDYLISITDEEILSLAKKMRAERLRFGGLVEKKKENVECNDENENEKNEKSVHHSTFFCESIVPTIQSQSRVILAGMGADESLGGYHRYTRKSKKQQNQQNENQYQQNENEKQQNQNQNQQQNSSSTSTSASNEMQKDFERLWLRNLGRDDRCLSTHGKEGRFPFLDECLLFALSGIVSWAEKKQQQQQQNVSVIDNDNVNDAAAKSSSSTSYKNDNNNNFVVSDLFKDKKLLRFGAEYFLGLDKVASKAKKAIQFGTKIANRRNHGEQQCI